MGPYLYGNIFIRLSFLQYVDRYSGAKYPHSSPELFCPFWLFGLFDSLWLFYIKMITRLVGVCVCVSDKVVLS